MNFPRLGELLKRKKTRPSSSHFRLRRRSCHCSARFGYETLRAETPLQQIAAILRYYSFIDFKRNTAAWFSFIKEFVNEEVREIASEQATEL